MHFAKISLPIFILFLFSAFEWQDSKDWIISESYTVMFETSYAEGQFSSIKGSIQFDEKNLESSYFQVIIDVSSISTGNSLKDKHAKKSKWFGVEEFPIIKFTSSSISQTVSGYEVAGILNMHGVRKKVSIPFTFTNNTFKGNFIVNRLDYKVGTDTGFSSIVGNDVKIDLVIPVVRN